MPTRLFFTLFLTSQLNIKLPCFFLQWLGMWHALTHSFLLLKRQPVVFPCHLSITRKLLLVKHVLVAAKTERHVSCKNFFFSLFKLSIHVFSVTIRNGAWCRTESDLQSVTELNAPTNDSAPVVQCTAHNCPIQVHWHVKENYKGYWRVKITISNLNYRLNYSQWTLVVEHPNFNNTVEVYSFVYKPLTPFISKSEYLYFLFNFSWKYLRGKLTSLI